MKAKLLVVSLSLLIAVACSKDKFNSTPTLIFESINGDAFTTGQTLNIKLKLTDKEGDFDGNDTFMTQKLYYKRVSSVCPEDPADTGLYYDIPAFTTNKFLDVNLNLNFSYGTNGPYQLIDRCASGKDDSLYFRFWIRDAADHISDTVNTPAFKLVK